MPTLRPGREVLGFTTALPARLFSTFSRAWVWLKTDMGHVGIFRLSVLNPTELHGFAWIQ